MNFASLEFKVWELYHERVRRCLANVLGYSSAPHSSSYSLTCQSRRKRNHVSRPKHARSPSKAPKSIKSQILDMIPFSASTHKRVHAQAPQKSMLMDSPCQSTVLQTKR